MDSFELLKELCDIPGVGGDETNVQKFILEYLLPLNPFVDISGNIYLYISTTNPSTNTKTILLASHMDEVGFIISQIDPNTGRIYLQKLGYVQISGSIGEEVIIKTLTGSINGIITTESVNNLSDKKDSDIYIDTGYSSDQLIELGVEIGAFVSFTRKTKIWNSGLIVGKAIDDRFGCYIMLNLIDDIRLGKVILPNNLLFLFTIREEIIQQGVINNIQQWHVDIIIVLDTINAHEYFSPSKQNTRSVGKGPVVIIYNKDGLTNPPLNNHIKILARQHNIPIQLGIQPEGETDVSRFRYPVPSSILSIVVRNVHTPFSIASLKDITNLSRLLHIIIL